MAPLDSDSSEGEDNDYTQTSVLLGYASKEPSDDTISHLGGQPTWLDPSTPPLVALARCRVCKDLMVLLLQLNGDLPEFFPGHERRLYVLTCRQKTCRRKEGSVRALRGVRITEISTKDTRKEHGRAESKQAPPQAHVIPVTSTDIGERLFGGKPVPGSSSVNPFSATNTSKSANHFSTSTTLFTSPNLSPFFELDTEQSQSTSASGLPETFASALSLNSPSQAHSPPPPPEPWPPGSKRPPPYPLLFLVDADYETLDKINDDTTIPRQAVGIDEEDGSSSQKEDKDVYESLLDKTFQKFADRLAQNPDQVIRYEFKGQPLLYSKSDSIGKLLAPSHPQGSKANVGSGSRSGKMPVCRNCGAERVFEVQLTPHTITELEAEEVGLEGMDWGTIIVGVCERDCVPTSTASGKVYYIEEWVGVQWEEIGERR